MFIYCTLRSNCPYSTFKEHELTHSNQTPYLLSLQQVWNDTVANLTLMALGSSAPEIMLSVIGIMGLDYFAEELGPSTIVGSAAFNLLMIIAVCVSGIPPADGEGETGIRRISDMGVFTITGVFSVFAYLWLLIILMVITPNVVDPWEGILSFLYFPIVVCLAYGADRNWFKEEKIAPTGHIIQVQGQHVHAYAVKELLKASGKTAGAGLDTKETAAYLTRMAMAQSKPSRAQLRINAMRQMTGGKRVVPKDLGKASDYHHPLPSLKELEEEPEVNFASGEYSVLESGGSITVSVIRIPSSGTFTVKYATEGITATAGDDFEAVSGTLEFADGEEEKEITIKIKDDDDVEDDETFMVKIMEPSKGKIGPFGTTTVTIVDDDEPGEIGFKDDVSLNISESAGMASVVVNRINGSKGQIACKYETIADTAQPDVDFIPEKGTLTFKDGEIKKLVNIHIKDTGAYEKSATFKVKLSDYSGPEKSMGFASHPTETTVTIVHDEAAKAVMDDVTELMNMNLDQYKLGSASWADQFTDAIFEIGCDEGESPATIDYVMHVATVPFKVIYAIIPPTTYGGGWVTFYCALVMVGVTTIVIGDIASLFGCVWGLDKASTAITFVALGTSLPDTFASKSAAVGDETADAAIGNVTGSNAVNVFLGLGLPWMMAAIKWSVSGPTLDWYQKYGVPILAPAGLTEDVITDQGFDIEMLTKYTSADLDPMDGLNGFGFNKIIMKAEDYDNRDEGLDVVWIKGNDVQKCEMCAKDVADASGWGKAAFIMPAGGLGFSVIVFCSCAMGCFALLSYRRANCGGELGGPPGPAKIHSIILAGLWFTYVALSIMYNYKVI